MIFGGLALLIVGFSSGYYLGTQKTFDKVYENTSTPITVAPTPVMNDSEVLTTSKETTPSPETSTTLKKFSSGSEFFKFSVMAPADATAIFPPTAGTGGIYLKNSSHPYGLVVEYTTLSDESARQGYLKKEYDSAVPADINFDGKEAVILKGIASETVYPDDTSAVGVDKDFAYTKYIFRNEGDVYIVSLQTDSKLSNYETLLEIAKSWKFE